MIERHAAGFMLDVAGIPRFGCDDDYAIVVVKMQNSFVNLVPQIVQIHLDKLHLTPVPGRLCKWACDQIGLWVRYRQLVVNPVTQFLS